MYRTEQTGAKNDAIVPVSAESNDKRNARQLPESGHGGLTMLASLIGFLISALLIVLGGWLFRIVMRRKSDDVAQMEYLSRWSDMIRLRKNE